MKIINLIITVIYKPLFIVYAFYTLITFLIGVTESLKSALFLNVVSYIPSSYYDITYQYRYETIFGFLVFLTLYMLNNLEKLRKQFARACKSVDDFQREQGDEIAKVILDYSQFNTIDFDEKSYNKLSRQIDEFLRRFTTHICKVFSSYTGKPCHVAIKTLNEEKITSWVRETSMSDSTRSSIDEALLSFPYQENTAFTRILDMEKFCYYLNNHLRFSSIINRYKNANPNWKKSYNATLVVPITLKTHPQKINKENVWGFICVDNKGGGFDKAAAWLLSSFARICFNVFENIPIVNHHSLNNEQTRGE